MGSFLDIFLSLVKFLVGGTPTRWRDSVSLRLLVVALCLLLTLRQIPKEEKIAILLLLVLSSRVMVGDILPFLRSWFCEIMIILSVVCVILEYPHFSYGLEQYEHCIFPVLVSRCCADTCACIDLF